MKLSPQCSQHKSVLQWEANKNRFYIKIQYKLFEVYYFTPPESS